MQVLVISAVLAFLSIGKGKQQMCFQLIINRAKLLLLQGGGGGGGDQQVFWDISIFPFSSEIINL